MEQTPREYMIEVMEQMFKIDRYEEGEDYIFNPIRWLSEERNYRAHWRERNKGIAPYWCVATESHHYQLVSK